MLILCIHHLSPEEVAQIQVAAPEARIVVTTDKGEILRHAPEAEIIYSGHSEFNEEIFNAAPHLKWVQVSSAGVERYLFPALLNSDVTLTSSAGVFNKPIAESVLAMMFAFARGIHRYRDNQREKKWKRTHEMEELEGKTLGVVGLGEIGYELAGMVQGLNMRVIGIKRSVPETPPEGVEWVRGMDALLDLAREADHLVDTLPNTPATRGILNRDVFEAMKPTAYVYNIGRGVTIDQDAMIEALREGKIAGAGLDVTTPEPLPPDSPLWEMENVIITPHVSGSSPRTRQRGVEFFIANLRRCQAGEPLRSEVDKQAGY
ncbi:MAG: D-2-hydroxyacid dehydrogenase [Armatimonadetes bacterium]|nr:D-2-hydroxyacid dehydrogenase [Armatimonadota bacterium]